MIAVLQPLFFGHLLLGMVLLSNTPRSDATVLDTSWHFDWTWTWAPWVTVLFVVTVVVGVAYLYSREESPANVPYRTLLGTLRLISIGLVLLMLSELLLSAIHYTRPRLVLLLDHSGSMAEIDPPTDDPTNRHENQVSRLDLVRRWLLADRGKLLTQWREAYDFEVFSVADGTAPLNASTTEELIPQIESLTTEGPKTDHSRLGDALTSVLDTRHGPPPAAIVLVSDGRTTAGRSLDEARRLARQQGVPLYPVGVGSPNAPPDVALTDLLADQVALFGDPLTLEVTLQTTGLAGQQVRLVVREQDNPTTLVDQHIEIPDDQHQASVTLLVPPSPPGRITYEVTASTAQPEQNLSNNRLLHTVEVRKEKVRVLLAAGYPDYEFRYLKNFLDRDSTFELASYLQEADIDYALQDATALAQLPLEEQEFASFDVVVLVDLAPQLLPPRWWHQLHQQVVKRGTGLVLIAGPRFFPWQYENITEVSNLAPLDLQSASPQGGTYSSGFQLAVTPLGERLASMQLAPQPHQSQSIWQNLPPCYWYCHVDQVKPAAQILATHPQARTRAGRLVPLSCLHYVGAGRVLYHGWDASWRWRFRVGDVFFARYWGQQLRYLAQPKLLEQPSTTELLVAGGPFLAGEPIRLQMRWGADQPREQATSSTEVLLESTGQPQRRITLQPSRIAIGHMQATASGLPIGQYRVSLSTPRLATPPAAVAFEVIAPPGERADITMNRAALESLAEETYGHFYPLDKAHQLAAQLPRGAPQPVDQAPPVELWNQWWMLLAITSSLTAEWILRKRRGML